MPAVLLHTLTRRSPSGLTAPSDTLEYSLRCLLAARWERDVNESLRAVRLADADTRFTFGCECGRIGCDKLIALSLVGYEQVRAGPRQFLVLDGHENPDVDEIVERHAGYVVVEKALGARFPTMGDPPPATSGPGSRGAVLIPPGALS